MNKNNRISLKKLSVFSIILLASFLNIIYASEENNDKYLIIDNISVWKYKDNTWYNTSIPNNDNYYLTYIDNKYLGMHKIKGQSKYILYDNNNNIVQYSGELFAYSNNFNIKNETFIIDEISDEKLKEVNSILDMNLNKNDLSINEWVSIDLDNNGAEDEIISVSNLDALDEQSKYFNLVYIILNNGNKQILINENIEERDVLNAPIYKIKYIFSIDSNYDNLILEEGYFSNVDSTKNILLENNNGLYNKVTIETEQKNTEKIDNKTDYTLYIVLAIILLIFMLGYFIFNIIKNREDVMDD